MIAVTEPGLVRDLEERQYHADPVEGGSLSSTMAKEILKSPAHLRHYLDAPRESKAAFDFGSVVHTLVLGTGWEPVALEFDSWRTKESKEARSEVEASGRIALLRKDFDRAEAVATSVLEHPEAGKLFRKGEAEVSAFGQHESGVWLRGRFDWLVNGWLIDLKSLVSADPRKFNRAAWDFGYDIQAVHYLDTYELATGEKPRGFLHVNVEKEAPYNVAVVKLSERFIDLGRQRHARAVAAYAEATRTGQWPGYPGIVHQIDPLPYMEYQETEDND